MARADVILVVPPFANAAYPALGPSVLSAACQGRGITARVFYANLLFAARIGFSLYQRLALSSPEHLAGEALFSSWAFDESPSGGAARATLKEVFNGWAGVPSLGSRDLDLAELCDVVPQVEAFLDAVVDEVCSFSPRVVGFSSVFQQQLSSIALARRLKERCPAVCTVLGGGNASLPMGQATADVTPAFDVVFSGEADAEFPRFCEGVLRGDGRPSPPFVIACEPIKDMDAVETPRYEDYFERAAAYAAAGALPAGLPDLLMFEASRGCWYGAKKHCTFCGLNGLEIGYRQKSAGRVLAELRALSGRHAVRRLHAADNIMPHDFAARVLPALAGGPDELELFFEVKANLREQDLDLLVRAGVTNIQPGIESFSSNVLRLMAKGVTARQCIVLLRECMSRQIHVSWNIIYGFPGETEADYEAALALLPAVEHLQPPVGFGPVRIDRYSPYQADPEKYGVGRLHPLPAYRAIYPPCARLADIAYTFRGSYDTAFTRNGRLVDEFCTALVRWRRRWAEGPGAPRLWRLPVAGVVIEDTRRCAPRRYHVLGPGAADVLSRLRQPVRADTFEPSEADAFRSLLEARAVVEYDGHFISLVTEPDKGTALRKRGGPGWPGGVTRSLTAVPLEIAPSSP
jgi:ribosomal peptide maturation radical SAM protein 1